MKVWPSQDKWTGDAWPSSVRGLNCPLKWVNERNPRCVLQVSHETAPAYAPLGARRASFALISGPARRSFPKGSEGGGGRRG